MSTGSQIYILGTRIDNLTKKEVLHKVSAFLKNNHFHHIATVNPEIILKTRKDTKYKEILNNTSLNVADGTGIKFAFWRYGQHLKTRYTGITLMWDILHIANEKKLSIYLVANKNGLSSWQESRDAILKVYPNLQIDGKNIDVLNHDELVINHKILITNLGAPHQELFINRLRNSQGSVVSLGVGVGGAFDYVSGKITRAPKCMRNIGLEWLYRLFKQPQRIKRIYHAVIIFPIFILINKK